MDGNSYYSVNELNAIGIISNAKNSEISKKASLYPSGGGIELGEYVRIDDFCVLVGNIKIGNHVHIASHCGIHASGESSVVFDDYSGISSNVQIYAASDDFDGEYLTGRPGFPDDISSPIYSKVVLGKYSQVGTGSTILPGGNLGEGTAVGAMTLVKEALEPWKIYAGIPAKCIQERKNHFLQKMEEMKNDRILFE